MWRVETTVYIQGSNRKTSAGWSTPEECWPHSGNLLCRVAAERQSRLNKFSWQRHKVHSNKGASADGWQTSSAFFFLSFSFLSETSVEERSNGGCFVFAAFCNKSWCICNLTRRLMLDSGLPGFHWHHIAEGASAVADSLHVSLSWRSKPECCRASQMFFFATFHCRMKPFDDISTCPLTIKTIKTFNLHARRAKTNFLFELSAFVRLTDWLRNHESVTEPSWLVDTLGRPCDI